MVCGGIGAFRPVNEEDLKIWNLVRSIASLARSLQFRLFQYKEHLEKKIQKQFNLAKTFALKPSQVATQVVAGQNYFFKVELPEKKYATARVYHVPWQQDTHGKDAQVAVHEKLSDSASGEVAHF